MIQLGCVLGRMGNFALPAFLASGAPSLAAFFEQGSLHDIQLQVDASFLGQALKPGRADYFPLDLQLATMQLTRNPPPPARSARVAVLFANYYRPHHGVLGVMFDRGKPSPWDDPNPPPVTMASAREGCAIFLGAIANLRGSGLPYQVQAQFTTLHEMGHLFNLQHADTPRFPPNLMATSESSAPYKPKAFHFLPRHQQQLSRCSTSPFVWPGGEPFQGESGDLPSDSPRRLTTLPAEPFGLQMKLCMSQSEFWAFEPVELEVEIAVASGVARRFTLPDIVDPGYDEFVIWLEDPRGERRRYRSPRHYCSVPGRLVITPQRPFKRDISIFLDAGGFTFCRPGVWRIWVEFHVGRGRGLVSPTIEVNVLPRTSGSAYNQAAARLLHPESARLLYHRLLRPGVSDGLNELVAQAEESMSVMPLGGIEYALAHALAERAQAEDAPDLALTAEEYMRRARDRESLGEHRRSLADRFIAGRTRRRGERRGRHAIPEPPASYEVAMPHRE